MYIFVKFDKILSLQGHTDWVRCLEFAKMNNDPNTLILASSSQDKYIRIWKISETLDVKSSNTEDLLNNNSFSSKDILESFSLNNMLVLQLFFFMHKYFKILYN